MTADIRTAAQREISALRRVWKAMGCEQNPDDFKPSVRDRMWDQIVDMAEKDTAGNNRLHRENQQLEAALRAARVTPTREQIAGVLRRHNFDELLLGNIEWDGYTAVCACGWSSEECKMPGDAHEAHSEHAAAHVLVLMAELAEGEK